MLTALLGTVLAVASLLGPLGLGELVYRTSPTTLNQLEGSDLAALVVAAPAAWLVAVLLLRGHPVGAPLAAGLGGYAVYTYAQVVVGQEYLRVAGNVERFFPLLLSVFVLGEATLVLGWHRATAADASASRRLERVTGWVLVAVAGFLVLGLHLPTMVTAWTDPGSLTEYASAPTPFWLVKLMDLGIVVPAALATGTGLLRGADWSRRVVRPFLAAYTLLATSVLAMAVVMLVDQDPDASPVLAAGFGCFTVALCVLLAGWCRPLFGPPAAAGSRGQGA